MFHIKFCKKYLWIL